MYHTYILYVGWILLWDLPLFHAYNGISAPQSLNIETLTKIQTFTPCSYYLPSPGTARDGLQCELIVIPTTQSSCNHN